MAGLAAEYSGTQNTFDDRKSYHDVLVNAAVGMFDGYTKFGHEYSKFLSMLKRFDDPLCKFIRHVPDILVNDSSGVWFLEVKTKRPQTRLYSIEEDSFLTCKRINEMGSPVYLGFGEFGNEQIEIIKITNLVLAPFGDKWLSPTGRGSNTRFKRVTPYTFNFSTRIVIPEWWDNAPKP